MSLYKEALIEANNLKKLTEEDAKKKILEEISPLIKKAITEGLNEVTDNFFVEDNMDGDDVPAVDPSAQTIDPTGLDNAGIGGLPNPENTAPLAPKGSEEPHVMSATMPGSDGKITVDFEDLFSSGDPLGMGEPTPVLDAVPPVPVEGPAPAAPGIEPLSADGNEIITQENFEKALTETAQKINEAFYLENLTLVGKEKIQQNLFQLLENLDFLKQNKIINENNALKSENKLDFLFLKLKEAKLSNSYIETDRRDINNMKSLKEYAAKLFEEDSTYSDTADKKLNHKSTASDEHAMKQSGVSPEVGGPESLKAKTEKQNAKAPAEKHWAEGEAGIKEEVDVDEAELKEAIESLTKNPKEEGWEEADPEEKDPSHKNLKEDITDDLAPVDDSVAGDTDPLAALGAGDDLEGVDPDIVLNIELPAEIEDALANVDVSTMGDVKVDVASTSLGGGADADLSDDVELDFNDDSEPAAPVGDSTPVEGVDDDLDESAMKLKEAFTKLLKKHKVLEAKLVEVEAENKSLKESVTQDRLALKEANLFLAKNIYFTKFLQRKDISTKNMKKIVEYLDRAENISDAKSIYNKIKVKLTESAKASNKLAGSPSKVTTPGSANKTLNESVNPSLQTEEGDFIDASRWAVIAGIKKA